MYIVSAQGVDERMINVHYYYHYGVSAVESYTGKVCRDGEIIISTYYCIYRRGNTRRGSNYRDGWDNNYREIQTETEHYKDGTKQG